VANDPGMIALVGGNLAETFPVEEIKAITLRILNKTPFQFFNMGFRRIYARCVKRSRRSCKNTKHRFATTRFLLYRRSAGRRLDRKGVLNEGDVGITDDRHLSVA
jgi:hypothetical protein